MEHLPEPLVRKVDCVRLYVHDLDAGLAFYRAQLGHELVWRSQDAVGLRMSDSDAEIVLAIPDGAGRVRVGIYSVGGRLVRSLNDRPLEPGVRSLTWDGLTDRGTTAAAGVYFCRLRSALGVDSRRLVLIRDGKIVEDRVK